LKGAADVQTRVTYYCSMLNKKDTALLLYHVTRRRLFFVRIYVFLLALPYTFGRWPY